MAKGGPDGGDGGGGGDVWLVADRNVASLYGFRDHPHRRAGSGTHGMGKGRHGKAGADLEVPVPEGTVVRDADGAVVADLVDDGRPLAGGAGRRRAAAATPASCPTAAGPRRSPSRRELGEERWLDLELKLMADVALVGFPNAGQEHADLADLGGQAEDRRLPFTTLEPHLGVVRFDEHEFVVADIPGLIEGRQRGPGPGPPVPAPHRAGPGPGRPARPGRGRRPVAGRTGADPARRAAPLPARAGRPAPAGGRLQGRRGPDRTSDWDGRAALGRDRRGAAAAARAAWPTWSRRPGPSCPARPASSCTVPSRRGRGRAGRRRGVGRAGPAGACGPWPCPISPTPRPWPTPRAGCAGLGVDRALARAGARPATGSASAASSSTTSPTTIWPGEPIGARSAGRGQDRHLVAHRRATGAIVPAAIEKLCAEVAVLRAGRRPGRGGDERRHRRRPAGPRPRTSPGPPTRPSCRPSPRWARPTWSATTTGPWPPTAWSAARCCWPRSTSSTASSTCTPARPCRSSSTSGVVPVVNENDAIADDEIRFGDNDRLAALVVAPARRRPAGPADRHRRAAHRRPAESTRRRR